MVDGELPTGSEPATLRELGPGDTHLAFDVLAQLRPHLSDVDAFVALVDDTLRPAGYRIVASFDADEEVAAVAGFRIGTSLAWGRFLYVDDLVTRPDARSAGHGAALMGWLEDEALRLGCVSLHLDSGTERNRAHRFYLREGLDITSFHFATKPGPNRRRVGRVRAVAPAPSDPAPS